jgi:hypothetical protein
MRKLIGFVCVAVAVGLLVGSKVGSRAGAAQQEEKKDYGIPEVMKMAHGGDPSLVKKAIAGKATDGEAQMLLAMYKALKVATPPAGSKESWVKKTDALIKGAQLYADGRKDEAKIELTKASNCKACHSIHKG